MIESTALSVTNESAVTLEVEIRDASEQRSLITELRKELSANRVRGWGVNLSWSGDHDPMQVTEFTYPPPGTYD